MANYGEIATQNPTPSKRRKLKPAKVTAEMPEEKRKEKDKEKSKRILAPFPVGVSNKPRRIEGGGLLKRREA